MMLRLRPGLRLLRSLTALTIRPPPSPPPHILLPRSLHTSPVLLKKKGKGREKKTDSFELSPEMEEYLQLDHLKSGNDELLDHFRDQIFHDMNLHVTAESIARASVRTEDGPVQIGHVSKVVQKSPQLIIVDLAASLNYKNFVMIALRDLGAGISNEETGTLYVSVPKVTQEARVQLVKRGKVLLNKVKKDMDNLHSKWAHKLRPKDVKTYNFSNNDVFEAKQMLVSVVHEFHHKAEELWKRREKEILP